MYSIADLKAYKSFVAQHFSRVAKNYDQFAFLQREIATRLLERLDLFKINPSFIVDLGCGTGFTSQHLAKKYPNAKILSVDIAEGMIAYAKQASQTPRQSYICADGDQIPVKDQSIDFVYSNTTLHWFPEQKRTFDEIQRILKPEGLFLYSTLGPDTVNQLHQVLTRLEIESTFYNLRDMHDIGDSMLQAQFQNVVVDRELINLTYQDPQDLLHDLIKTGLHNPTALENILNEVKTLIQFYRAFQGFKTPEGLYPATFEVIYGHGWASLEKSSPSSCMKTAIPIEIENS